MAGLVPEEYVAEGLLVALDEAGLRRVVLLVRARGTRGAAHTCGRGSGLVDVLPAYHSEPVE